MEQPEDANVTTLNKPSIFLKVLRAGLLATTVYAPLVWIYVSVRIIYNNISPWDLFIDGVPYFHFWVTGLWAFMIGFMSLIAYILIRDPSKPLINIQITMKKP